MKKKNIIKNYTFPQHKINLLVGKDKENLSLFQLSSHDRAKQSLDFGLSMKDTAYNIFVVGENLTGRMDATLAYIKSYVKDIPVPPDWVYLNNFKRPNRPRPYKLPTGTAREFKFRMGKTIKQVQETLKKSFNASEFTNKIKEEEKNVDQSIQKQMEEIRKYANMHNLDLQRLPDGSIVTTVKKDGEQIPFDTLEKQEQSQAIKHVEHIQHALQDLNRFAANESEKLLDRVDDLYRWRAEEVISPFINRLHRSYDFIEGIKEWLTDLKEDLLLNLKYLLPKNPATPQNSDMGISLESHYGVNVVAENDTENGAQVVVEPNPSYENLFGKIKYQSSQHGFITNFNMIRSGALHKANGGILVLRAEDIASHPLTWHFLKACLRDREIRIEELHRISGIPTLDAPEPEPIPLDVQIILVGAPYWYDLFFYHDQDFQNYFKVKAEIDPTVKTTPRNLSVYATLLNEDCSKQNIICEKHALEHLLGHSSRKAGHRQKLSTQFEFFTNILHEAAAITLKNKKKRLTKDHLIEALEHKEYRNSGIRDRIRETIEEDITLIQTKGKTVGQVNGLTVLSIGSESFGMPSRITAQTYIGKKGVLNIEQQVRLSGPIQQKGVLTLEGYLRSIFSQEFPLSFSASLTFEQNYSGVEGDSASLAEVIALISSLSGVPVNQEIAITGSMNQLGQSQPIGGVIQKIEGFYFTCKHQGLTGNQGVIVPKSNMDNIILSDKVSESIKKKQFHLWAVETVAEAIEIMLDMPAGDDTFVEDAKKSPKTIYGKAYKKLMHFDQLLRRK
jgi:lon-related putative ATP-dependent protease